MAKLGSTRIDAVVVGTECPRVTGYRIQEIVTADGLYIEWDGLYGNIESAREKLSNLGYVKQDDGTYHKEAT